MRTISQLRESNLQDSERQALNYIERMALLLDVNILDLPVEHFCAPESESLITDKATINQLLTNIPSIKKEVELSTDQLQAIAKAQEAFADRRKERVRSLLNAQASAIRDAKVRFESAENLLRIAYSNWTEAQQLLNKEIPVEDEIKKVLNDRFWDYLGHTDTALTFVTANEISMSLVNPAAKLNLHVKLGKFKVCLDLTTAVIKLYRYKNNLDVEGYYHPYCSNSANICWGNAAETVGGLLASGKFSDVFAILSSLLVNYAPDATPWRALEEFHRAQENGGSLRPHCSVCECPEDECECYYCDRCDENYREPCEEHYCSNCQSYTAPDCCCRNCDNSMDNCTCCSICSSNNRDDCGCCQECERRDSRCTRCRECDRHEGHAPDCCENPEREIEQE